MEFRIILKLIQKSNIHKYSNDPKEEEVEGFDDVIQIDYIRLD